MPNDQEWDEIHFGADAPPPADTGTEDDDDIQARTFGSDEGIENAANVDEVDPIADPVTDPPADPNADPNADPPADPNADPATADPNADPPADPDADPNADPPVADQTGIEMYLSQFDIEAGMIQFEDGTSKHFDELESDKQAEVLQQLHASQATSVEDQFGLDESEVGLLNYLRENKVSVEQMVEGMVQERINNLTTANELATADYTTMEADAIYTKFLQEASPDATAEEIAADLEKAKELSNFTKLTDSLRTQYVADQATKVAESEATAKAEHDTLIETQRQEIVNAVVPMEEIAGVTLDQNIKNNVLGQILEVNEDGDSAFMDEVFAGPESLFKAAFWYTYGESLMMQRDEYWKKEKSAAYKRGKEDALGGGSSAQGRSFTKPPEGKPHAPRPPGTPPPADTDDDWSSLHT